MNDIDQPDGQACLRAFPARSATESRVEIETKDRCLIGMRRSEPVDRRASLTGYA